MGTLRASLVCLLIILNTIVAVASNTKEDYFADGLESEYDGKTEKAIQEYQQALSIDPLYIPAHRRLMDLQKKHGKTVEVQNTYEKLLKSYPDNAVTQYLTVLSRICSIHSTNSVV